MEKSEDFFKARPDTLIYDRDCELCRSAKKRIQVWDRAGRVSFLAFQAPEFQAGFPDFDRSDPGGIWPEGLPPKAMLYIDHWGSVWHGMEAFRKMLPRLPGGKALSLVFFIPGFPWIAAKLYDWLARNRYRLFGPSSP